jgi:hypothetical protein
VTLIRLNDGPTDHTRSQESVVLHIRVTLTNPTKNMYHIRNMTLFITTLQTTKDFLSSQSIWVLAV